MEYIAFDCHKKYTYAVVEDEKGRVHWEGKIVHERGALAAFLKEECYPGSPVVVETVGNWCWIVEEIEQAGCVPRLVHAAKAKLMLGMTKYDQQNGQARCPRFREAPAGVNPSHGMDSTRQGSGQTGAYPGKNSLSPTKNPTQAAESPGKT